MVARTLMFTDIEGSTRLLTALGDEYPAVLAEHRSIVRQAVAERDGTEVDTQGDAFFLIFTTPGDAVATAVSVQHRLADRTWPAGAEVRVRIGIHTGEPSATEEGYVGIELHEAARICSAAHGGQVVISRATRDGLGDLGPDVALRDLGAHRLKDIATPMRLFDLVVEGLDSRFPPLRTIGARPTNLRSDPPALVGRSDLITEAVDRLRPGGPRLLTLLGPGGIGKSSLAVHVATSVLPDFADGVFATWLATVDDAASVPTTVADSLSLRASAGRTPEQIVTDYLADRELLLLLDNVEHLTDAAPFVDRLLQAAPRVKVLLTSRVPLRVAPEAVLDVPSLAVADPTDTEALPAAADLFLRRACQVHPQFRADESGRKAILDICRRLDGIPLAIELAAARVRLMPLGVMAERIRQPLDVAAGGSRGVPERHQTLRATIGWSYGLLHPSQQQLLRRLAVFAAPFTLAAAETVCEASLDDLANLLDHSLIRSFDEWEGRLGMLETVKAYAAEMLEQSTDVAEVRDRHARWAAELARNGGPELLCGRHEKHLARFDAEREDLDAAMDWLNRTGRGHEALAMAADLAVFWDTRGHLIDGVTRLEQTLADAPDADAGLRARAQFNLGRLASQLGYVDKAEAALEAARPALIASGDGRSITLLLSHLGAIVARRGDDGRGVALCQEALEVARASGDPWTVAVGLNNLAFQLMGVDPTDPRVRDLLEECLRIRRRLGEKRTLSISLGNQGEQLMADGELAAAEPILEEALSLAVDVGFEMMIAEARRCLGQLARLRGDAERAELLLRDALSRAERLADADLLELCRAELELIVAGDRAAAR